MRAIGVFVLLVFFTARCAGTETDNPATNPGPTTPLVSFEGSDCKRKSGEDFDDPTGDAGIGTVSQALEHMDTSGLGCFQWSRSDEGNLDISLLNLVEGCGYAWDGARAFVEGGTVELEAINPECGSAACGNCIYDLGFEVEDVPKGELRVRFSVTDEGGDNCNDGDAGVNRTYRYYSIPTGEPEGIRCEYLPDYAYFPPQPPCTRHTACDEACDCGSGSVCEVPASEPDGDARCLVECTSAEDCPVPEAFECIAGVCQLPG